MKTKGRVVKLSTTAELEITEVLCSKCSDFQRVVFVEAEKKMMIGCATCKAATDTIDFEGKRYGVVEMPGGQQ